MTEDIKIININPEPIGIFSLPAEKHMEFKKIIQSILVESSNDLRQQFDGEPYTRHICNAVQQNLFNSFSELKELKSYIEKYLIDYINIIGYESNEFVIHSSWLNDSAKKSRLAFHLHSNSFVSANYYVNFDPKNHSLLDFKNDRAERKLMAGHQTIVIPNSKKLTTYNSTSVRIPAKEGQILVWRSHMIHGYNVPNKTDNRITLSLNAMPKVLNNGRYSFTVEE